MSDKKDNINRNELADVIDTVVIYKNSKRHLNKRKAKKIIENAEAELKEKLNKNNKKTNKKASSVDESEVLEPEEVPKNYLIKKEPKKTRTISSSDMQLQELSTTIITGSDDKDSVRKRISKILRSGDTITESKAVMITLARKELEKIIKATDAIDSLESVILDRIAIGNLQEKDNYELSAMIQILERSMARGLTIVEKVINNPAYEEFLLSYRDLGIDEDNTNIGTVAHDKNSRQKLRELMHQITEKLNTEKQKNEK